MNALRLTILILLTLACLPFPARAQAQPGSGKRMNIIAIVTDDQGRWALGAYGNKDVKTPHMDRIAAEGARFTNAFVATPVCSPSRATFLTGLYGTQVGITDWITMNEAERGVGLPPKTTTWVEVLRDAGYATALIGKWHLGNTPEYLPTNHGYQHFYGMLNGGAHPINPRYQFIGEGGTVETRGVEGANPDLLADDAIRWIDQNKDKPFALSLHFREPHMPYGPVQEKDSVPFKDLDPQVPDAPGVDQQWLKETHRAYYAAIHSADRNIGRVLEKLEQLGLAENTIILFTSDHGYNIGQHSIHGKGNGQFVGGRSHGPKRPNMFDESVTVPLLIKWPGVVKPGTTVDAMVSNVDTFSSILGMLGVDAPKDNTQHGRDFSPFLRGETVNNWRDAVFAQYDLHNAGLAFMRMIRTRDWKLIRHHLIEGHDELYNLKIDAKENRNVYHNPPARDARERLQGRLTEWQESLDDPVLKLDKRPAQPGPLRGE